MPERSEHARDLVGLVGPEEHGRTRLGTERRELVLGQELRDRRARLTVLAVDDVREPLRAPLLRELLEPFEVGPRVLLRNRQVANRRRVGEDLELRAARELGRVLDLEPEAQVGLVRPVAEHRVGVGQPLERDLELDPDRLPPDRLHHLLHQGHDELDVREGHLDVELRQLVEPIRAQVLVSEAAGDLVVALEARDHEQLLEDLRRLREREELALLEPRRDEEVAGAFGRRLEEDRRLDVEEAGSFHDAPDDRDHLRAEAEVPLQPLAPQVEPAVPDAERLVDVLLVELERERRARREDLQLVDLELDLAGRDVRIHVLRRARRHLAGCAEDELVADVVGRLGRLGRALGVDDELADARRVAQVDEHEPAVVAAARHPARERAPFADEVAVQLARAEVAPAHSDSTASASDGNSTSFSCGRRSVAPSERTITVAFAPTRPACVSWPLSDRPA